MNKNKFLHFDLDLITTEDERYSVSLEEIFEVGGHYGHNSKRRNTKMSSYIYTSKHNRDIIDIRQTKHLFTIALNLIYKTIKQGGEILLYAPKSEIAKYIEDISEITEIHYVVNRWLGGTLTNFFTVNKSLKTLDNIENALIENDANSENENLKSYNTKKEKLMLSRLQKKLDKNLGGLKYMVKTPDLLIVLDSRAGRNAIREANLLDIPVISILDSNSNPSNIQYPIPMNDDAEKVLCFFLNKISKAILAGKADSASNKSQDNASKESAIQDSITLETFQTVKAV
ncbi:MAG: 30S ribosomal protein S2 [Rickettsiales bacterium]